MLHDYVPIVYEKIRSRGIDTVDDIFEDMKKNLDKKSKKNKDK